ncbi:phosphate regulon sensor histidine kinase PhoR [Marinimicrobium sp. ABcell2]|uniref:phosphate regulon sensor histidine kinase PhoR n=1 Tax=Marinimicrobium sp. ABcell2 TaxID=3069751 RepID=UPI0027AF97A9|nr:phosphate regulon sensor histidine kinase PhoR [Marinimicrobium sp. ABcell2]MDQ2076675.1 phosphate regulon sensor histidine kinase PhoR [Marinimicrobium sp. ABcell2]
MLRGFSAELRRLLMLLALGLIAGLWFGHMGWALFLASSIYVVYTLRQIYCFNRWLLSNSDLPPPEANRFWGEVYDRIYHMQRRQEKEKASLEAVISRVQETTSALRDGVIILDRRGYLDWWNPAAQRLLGFRLSDQGKSIINFVRHPRFVSYFDEGQYGEPVEIPSPRFNSKQLQFQITRFGNAERLVVVRDVTQLHKLEQMRQDFVANVSHELRTPLTVLTGYLETLSDSPNLGPQWQKALTQMEQQARRMAMLVNDLLALSKLETAEAGYNQKPVPLEPLLRSIHTEAQALSGELGHHITLECEAGVELLGSEKELHSAFSNLVTNAIKYTPPGGKIALKAKRHRQEVHISVQDNGPGFESKHIPYLTQRFYRVEASRNSSTGGAGLGLAIVKHVLLRHEGELQIRSEVGKGSEFTCVFNQTVDQKLTQRSLYNNDSSV